MAKWLLKSEPFKYSWDQMVKDKTTRWDGVRNFQAANNMKAMAKGDECFFYHSNEGKEIVGIVTVVKTFYPDPADETGKFGLVDVAAAKPLPHPVTLKQIKETDALASMALVRQSRLSVCPVSEKEWQAILKLGRL